MRTRRLISARPRRDETGASLIVALVLTAVIFTAFGFAFDIMRGAWVRGDLQAALDRATTAAAAQVIERPDGTADIDPVKALATARETYALGRGQVGGMRCLVPGGACWFEESFDVEGDVVTYRVIDSSRHLFGGFWAGTGYQDFELSSTAVLRNVDQERFS